MLNTPKFKVGDMIRFDRESANVIAHFVDMNTMMDLDMNCST